MDSEFNRPSRICVIKYNTLVSWSTDNTSDLNSLIKQALEQVVALKNRRSGIGRDAHNRH